MKKLKNNKGFTLVECLVAITIFATMGLIVSFTISMITHKQSTNLTAERGLNEQMNKLMMEEKIVEAPEDNEGIILSDGNLWFDMYKENGVKKVDGKDIKVDFNKQSNAVANTYLLSMVRNANSVEAEGEPGEPGKPSVPDGDVRMTNVPNLDEIELKQVGNGKIHVKIEDDRSSDDPGIGKPLLIMFPPGYVIAIKRTDPAVSISTTVPNCIEIKPGANGKFKRGVVATIDIYLMNEVTFEDYPYDLVGEGTWFGADDDDGGWTEFEESPEGSGNYVLDD